METPARAQQKVFRAAIIIFVAGAFALTLFYLLRSAPRYLRQVAIGKKEVTLDLSALVIQIRELSRLETASMRIMHVSSTRQSYGMIPDKVAGDEITFLAVGDVIAGVDLSTITRDNVRMMSDGTLVLELPPAQILVSRLDNRESRVIHRETGLLRSADQDLESRARQHGEITIRQEAMRKGILPMASRNGEVKLANFLHAVGFDKVRFEQPKPPQG